MKTLILLVAVALAVGLASGVAVGSATGEKAETKAAVAAKADPPPIIGRKPCVRLARWRDQIIAETYRPRVHRHLAEEAYSMACGPL